MLLTAGERISMALVAMAIAALGHTAKSFTGSQAGVITDSAHGKAKIIDITPGRIEQAISEGAIAIVAGFQGVSPGHQGHHHPGPRRAPTPPRSPWPPRWAPRSARSTPTSTASSPPTRASSRPPASSTASPWRRCSRWRRRAPRSCTCGASSTPAATRCRSTSAPPSPRRKAPGSSRVPEGEEARGTGHHRRSRPRPERGQGHRGRRTGQGRRGRPDLRGAGLGRGQPRHGRPERLGRRDRPHRHLVHAAARRRQHRDERAGQDPGRGRLREAALRRPDRQGLADRRRHALPPGHHRQVLLRRWPRPA